MTVFRILPCVLIALCLTGCNAAFLAKLEAEKAEAAKRRAGDAKPEPGPRILPETYLAAGQMLECKGDFSGAITQYEKAVVANPKMGMGYNRLGIAHQKLGHLTEAESAFNRGIQAEPAVPYLRNNLGFCHMAQGRWDDAEHDFRAALSLRPDFQRARMNLATVLGHTGRLDASLHEFSQAVPLDVAHYNVGILCLQDGRYDDAGKAFQNALAVNPECPGAKKYLNELRRLASRTQGPMPNPAGTADKPVPLAGGTADEPAGQP